MQDPSSPVSDILTSTSPQRRADSRATECVNSEFVFQQEQSRIRQRREIAYGKENVNAKPLEGNVGLALSGGGVRSATFCLGALQALFRFGILKRVDYLSTVSGGGYVGSCLTWFCSSSPDGLKEFPFGTDTSEGLQQHRMLAWLREHGNVVTPGGKMGIWAFIGSIFSATLINLLILLPLAVLPLLLLKGSEPHFLVQLIHKITPASWPQATNLYGLLIYAGLLFVGLFILRTIVQAFSARKLRTAQQVVRMHFQNGKRLKLALVLVSIGCLPGLYDYFSELTMSWLGSKELSLMSVVTGIFSIWGANKAEQAEKIKSKRMLSIMLWFGALMILTVILLVLYGYTDYLWESLKQVTTCAQLLDMTLYDPRLMPFAIMLVLALLLALFANSNHVSAHRYYRNALMKAYMPRRSDLNLKPNSRHDPDRFQVSDIEQTDAPYHLINVAMNTVGSGIPKRSARGAENFIFSPLYSGFDSHYVPTKTYEGGSMKLATAMAISGAAVNPNMYATRARPVSFLMTMMNIRLGYWIARPGRKIIGDGRSTGFSSLFYMLAEMFGSGLKETNKNVLISDGGHFENLGLYELLKRRCKYIIIVDASQDPHCDFGDLGKTIAFARVDLGAEVTIDLSKMRKADIEGWKEAYAVGTIEYAVKDPNAPLERGCLIYIKPTPLKEVARDVETYGFSHDTFPHDSTSDQWFDERQFESYRELGEQIVTQLCKKEMKIPPCDPANVQQALHNAEEFQKSLESGLKRTGRPSGELTQ